MRSGRIDLAVWQSTGPPDELRAVADRVGGIVVQNAATVTWVGRVRGAAPVDSSELVLAAADGDLAWLVDDGTPDYDVPGLVDSPVDAAEGDAASGPNDSGRLVTLTRDGRRVDLVTDKPVSGVEVDGDDAVVIFAERPKLHDQHHGWRVEYPMSRRRTTTAGLLSGSPTWSVADGGPEADFDPDDEFPQRPDTMSWPWLESDPRTVLRHGVRAAGLVWWSGADRHGDKINRRVLVRGHDPRFGRVVVTVDAGQGLVEEMRAVGAELWLILVRQRVLAVPNDHGVEVVAVSRDGKIRTVLEANSIDISVTNPPLVPRPTAEQIAAAVESVRSQFDQLTAEQRGTEVDPLVRGLSDPHVEAGGDWPDTTVIVTLRHESRPGLVLRRMLKIFDERGCAIERYDADTALIEDLHTGYLAPADEAVDGVLNT